MHIPKNTVKENNGNYGHSQISDLSIPFVPATWQKKGFVLPWNEEIGEKGCVLWQEQKKKDKGF